MPRRWRAAQHDSAHAYLEADILPTVARVVPELPRPLRGWGVQWLTQEIIAARERRLAPGSLIQRVEEEGVPRAASVEEVLGLPKQTIAASVPPPARMMSTWGRLWTRRLDMSRPLGQIQVGVAKNIFQLGQRG